jgi:hypothetical protein
MEYVEGLSCPGIQSFDDTVKNCLSIDSDALFSVQMTVKYVVWHECEFRWYSDSNQHNFIVEANVSVDSEKLYQRTDLLCGT